MRFILLLAALLLVFAGAEADEKAEPAEQTIEGEVLDLGCFTAREARGPDHQECAARCLKNGNPAGLISDDGEVYTIAASAPAFEKFAAQRVKITGSVRHTMILATAMYVWADDEWREVPLTKFGSPVLEESD